MLLLKYPEQSGPPCADARPGRCSHFSGITPSGISVLDYSKGFGYTDLITL
jgi:hypothetical protein